MTHTLNMHIESSVRFNGTHCVFILGSWLCNSPTFAFTVAPTWLRFVKLSLFLNGTITTAPPLTVSKLCFKLSL